MSSPIHAEIRVREPSACPVVPVSHEARVRDVRRSTARTSDGALVAEATVEGDPGDVPGMERVFSYDSNTVYRGELDGAAVCACGTVERLGCPVRNAEAEDGVVDVTFVAPDVETLREIVRRVDDEADCVSVRRLTRPGGEGMDERDLVFVDRAAFTDRQREVLETAHEMGYFERPKGANAGEVADALDISSAAFADHLAAAQTKLMDALFGERDGRTRREPASTKP